MRTYPITLALSVASVAVVATSLSASNAADNAGVEVSPLSQYLGFGYHADQEDELYGQEEGQRQLIIKGCMEEQGFQYWVRGPDWSPGNALNSDPNREYRESLSIEEQRRYQTALAGRPEGGDGLSAEEMQKFDLTGDGRIDFDERAALGCLGEAEHAVPGVFRIVGLLRSELMRMDDDLNNDPATDTAHLAYVKCLNLLGVPGNSIDEVRSALIDQAFTEEGHIVDTSRCEEQLDAAMYPVRLRLESELFQRNRDTIAKYAVPAS